MSHLPTLRDVAELAGVSLGCASQALRHSATVKTATREKIEAAARQIGYVPNPIARTLINRRWEDAPRASASGNLCLLITEPLPTYHETNYWTSFAETTASQGYEASMLRLGEFSSSSQMCRVLLARGVSGIAIAPIMCEHLPFPLPWDNFSWIQIGSGLTHYFVDVVQDRIFTRCVRVYEEVLRRGYQRILIYLPIHDPPVVDDHSRVAAFQYCRGKFQREGSDLIQSTFSPKSYQQHHDHFRETLDAFKPDAIIGFNLRELGFLEKEGIDVPGECGFAAIVNSNEQSTRKLIPSGCITWHRGLANIAGRLLISQIETGQKGLKEAPISHFVEPQWIEGDSLRPPQENCEHFSLHLKHD